MKKIFWKNKKINWKKNFVYLSSVFFFALTSCGPALNFSARDISTTYNAQTNLVEKLNLENLGENDTTNLFTLLAQNSTIVNGDLANIVANKLLYNWVKDFVKDETIDKGSFLGKIHQKTLKSIVEKVNKDYDKLISDYQNASPDTWLTEFQNELNPFGGTKEGWIINKTTENIREVFVDIIFENLYLSYKENDEYKNHISTTDLQNDSNWEKLKFYPSNFLLKIGNENYQKAFAHFQEFLFDQWMDNEKPFIAWNIKWDYGTSITNSLTNIYNKSALEDNDATLPEQPDYKWPAFDMGNETNLGSKTSFNAWQDAAKDKSIFKTNNKTLDFKNVFGNEQDAFQIYTNSELASMTDAYLSSGIIHRFNKTFKKDITSINEIDTWTTEQKQDILFNFLKNTNDATNPGIEIDNTIIFNQTGTFKDQKFVYPLRDLKENYWTLVRTTTGASAIALDGAEAIQAKTSLTDKVKEMKKRILFYQAQNSLIQNSTITYPQVNLNEKLKDYFNKNFNQLLVQYAISSNTTSYESKANLFFDNQNYLATNTTLKDLLSEIFKYNQILVNQNYLKQLSDNLLNQVIELTNKPFHKANNTTTSTTTVDSTVTTTNTNFTIAPYVNGLATPLAFKRNLNTTTDQDDFKISDTSSNSTTPSSNTTKSSNLNDGDYFDVTTFFRNTDFNTQASDFELAAFDKAVKTLNDKWKTFITSLKNSNENLFSNKNLIHYDSLEANYVLDRMLRSSDIVPIWTNLILANKIKLKYNSFNEISSFTLKLEDEIKNDFNENDFTNINKSLDEALVSTIFTEVFQNANLNVVGGYKFDDSDSSQTYASFLKKIKNFWYFNLYSQTNQGYYISSDPISKYIRTLYTIQWLIENSYENLRNYLEEKISFNTSSAFVWANNSNLNASQDFGQAETDSHKNDKLKNFKNFDYQDNKNIYHNPYLSYDLKLTSNNFLAFKNPVLSAKANVTNLDTTKTTSVETTSTHSTTSDTFRNLHSFYGLMFSATGETNNSSQLPSNILETLGNNFLKANPNGNLSTNTAKDATSLKESVGSFFNQAIFDKENNPSVDATVDFLINRVKSSLTFESLTNIVNNIKILFPSLTEFLDNIIFNNEFAQFKNETDKIAFDLPILKINLSQKINAIINVLNGHDYKPPISNNNELIKWFNDTYNTLQAKKTGTELIKAHDLKRFIGSPQYFDLREQSIRPTLKYFIPSANSSRDGYILYMLQVNYADIANETNFKNFVKILGMDAFIKTIVLLSQDPNLQSLAIEGLPFTNDFEQTITYDQRFYDVIGKFWTKLI